MKLHMVLAGGILCSNKYHHAFEYKHGIKLIFAGKFFIRKKTLFFITELAKNFSNHRNNQVDSVAKPFGVYVLLNCS